MQVTYDEEARACYIYFTSISPGGVAKTVTYQRLDVDLDENDQIVAIRLFESENCSFQGRLEYALQHSNVTYDELAQNLKISFSTNPRANLTVTWDCNIDLNSERQILGLEILFADRDYRPDDTRETLYAGNKLKFVSDHIVPFDSLLE